MAGGEGGLAEISVKRAQAGGLGQGAGGHHNGGVQAGQIGAERIKLRVMRRCVGGGGGEPDIKPGVGLARGEEGE